MVSRVESPNQAPFKRYGSTGFDLCTGYTVGKQSEVQPHLPISTFTTASSTK
jgi:hypothetical protein